MNDSKILIAAPIGGQKQYSINLWFQWIMNQSYKNIDICLCTNGRGQPDLIDKLRQVILTDRFGCNKDLIILSIPDGDDLSIIQKITYARERIRRYAVRHKYKAIFWLDTDTIPANDNAIEILFNWNLESVSGLYHYKNSKVPVALDPDTHTNFNMDKLAKAVKAGVVLPTWGTGYGCLMHRGQALHTAFDYELFGEERTDDFGHCVALEKAGIHRFIDPFILCKHFADNDSYIKINDMINLELEDG